MTDETVFARQVKDALENMYDPAHLQVHPLIEMLALKRLPNETGGEALRKALWAAVETLKPPASLPPHRPEWLSYRLLWLYHIQAMDRIAVQRDLGLAERTFYRRLQEADEAVASVLWEGQGSRQAVTGGEEALSSSAVQHARQKALRLIQSGHAQVVSLHDVLASAVETVMPLYAQRQCSLKRNVPPELPEACGGPAVLHQIVVNALLGALEVAGPEGLSLTVKCQDSMTVWRLSGLREAVSAEELLALSAVALSRELAQGSGGDLWVEHNDQASLDVLFTIGRIRHTIILVIDDDADARQLLGRMLGAHGYVVQEASSARAVPAILANAAPDVILLDVLMPQQDGWKLLQQLKTSENTAAIPVVICSVLSQVSLATALGAAAVVQKPVSEEALLETLGMVLATAGPAPRLADSAGQ